MNFTESDKLLETALDIIPLASQTFSKSLTQYPRGASPFFISRGEGANVWDIDGNKYTDFVNALLCINLGYKDPDVDDAVKKQLENGVSFTLAHPLESEVAQLIVDTVPCAEMVRFGKNGTDATSAAVRLARAYTNKEIILCCGYHGWQDWYIGTTSMNKGIPENTQKLSDTFNFNDISSLEVLFNEYKDRVAAVIMEPMNVSFPENNFLQEVKELTHKNNSVLIFDETITGFRFSNGGAQELFDVTPDLATFGKGVANGHPLSVICGKREIMNEMNNIFFSGTFGGETLSLAAAKATINKLKSEDVIKKIVINGEYLIKELNGLIEQHNLSDLVSTAGHPSWSFIMFNELNGYNPYEIKTYFLQEIIKRGFLTLGSHNLSYAHTKKDIDNLINAYKEVLPDIKEKINNKTLIENLDCKVLEPLFKVR